MPAGCEAWNDRLVKTLRSYQAHAQATGKATWHRRKVDADSLVSVSFSHRDCCPTFAAPCCAALQPEQQRCQKSCNCLQAKDVQWVYWDGGFVLCVRYDAGEKETFSSAPGELQNVLLGASRDFKDLLAVWEAK